MVLIGHDPDFSELVGWLTGAQIGLQKGGAAEVDLRGKPARGAGELRWLLRRDQIRLMGDPEVPA